MKTIIVAGAVNRDLAVLTNGMPTGALHVVEKPLTAFSIESILSAEKSEFNIHSAENSDLLIKKLSPHLEWNVKLRGLPSSPGEQSDELMWIRDDLLYDVDFSKLLARLRANKDHYIAVFSDNMPVLFYKKRSPLIQFKKAQTAGAQRIFRSFRPEMGSLEYCQELLAAFEWQAMQLDEGHIYNVDSPKSYHKLSMKLVCGEYDHLELEPHQADSRLIKGWHNRVEESSQLHNYGYLGDCVYVHKDSQLKGHVIIGKGCYIDRYADINNTIVMPGVYVGPYLDLNEAIVTGEAVIRVDTGIVIPIEDRKLIAALPA